MAVWTCPECRRNFGAVGRSHMCRPGLTEAEFLADTPEFVAPVFRRVVDHLRAVDAEADGALIIDPLDDKVLCKNGPTFCILEVKTRWVAVGFQLRRRLESARLSRKTVDYGGKYFHVINVDDPAIVDDEFAAWLTEAYHHGDERPTVPDGDDPMVPDDIDEDF